MAGHTDEDLDSRTASVGAPAGPNSQPPSRKSSLSKKKQRQRQRKASAAGSPVEAASSAADLGHDSGGNPQGANSTASETTNDAGASNNKVEASENANLSSLNNTGETSSADGNANSSASTDTTSRKKPRGRKASRKQSTKDGEKKEAPTVSAGAFQAVNYAYWRSRSTSSSSSEVGANIEHVNKNDVKPDRAVRVPSVGGNTHIVFQDDSGSDVKMRDPVNSKGENDDSDSDSDDVMSEGGDEVLLNFAASENPRPPRPLELGELTESKQPVSQQSQNQNQNQNENENDNQSQIPSNNASTNDQRLQSLNHYRSIYPTPPSTLVDLSRQHLEIQAKYFHYHTALADLDLSLPIRCTECTKEGHLAQVCPMKECSHCGAWEAHDSRFCPTRRRCWNCRGRGHDQLNCKNEKRFSHEVPCDFCGDSRHVEMQCDLLWKPTYEKEPLEKISISTSCAYCADSRHLIGDCVKRNYAMDTSSTWSLKNVDPKSIIKLNTIFPKGKRSAPYEQDGGDDSFSSDDFNNGFDNLRGKNRISQPPRGNIKIEPSIGRSNNFSQNNHRNGGGSFLRSRSRSPPGPKYPPRARHNTGGFTNGGGRGGGGKRNGKSKDFRSR